MRCDTFARKWVSNLGRGIDLRIEGFLGGCAVLAVLGIIPHMAITELKWWGEGIGKEAGLHKDAHCLGRRFGSQYSAVCKLSPALMHTQSIPFCSHFLAFSQEPVSVITF